MIEVGERTLLDRVIEACVRGMRGSDRVGDGEAGGTAAVDGEIVVVGPPRATRRDVRWVREEPAGGGPAAAMAAGLVVCSHPWVGVFAADLPFLTAESVHSLWIAASEAGSGCDGAVCLDAEGREQWLAAVYRREVLLSKLAEHGRTGVRGLALRRLVSGLRLLRITQPGHTVFDCDTWEDVTAARRISDRAPHDTAEARPEEGN